MDPSQELAVLRAIAISSFPQFSAHDRQQAFTILEEFKKYDGRIAVCVAWIKAELHGFEGQDITVATKLLALEVMGSFLQVHKAYASLNDADRQAFRQAVLQAARLLCVKPTNNAESRILARKIASIIEGIAIRDFPQRWTSFVYPDLFAPLSQGGIWYDETSPDSGRHVGLKICLECLQLLAEDCTDSDFNSKVQAARRNDVLKGLNEVVQQFLPRLYQILEHYAFLQQSQANLLNMHQYLISHNRTVQTLPADEAASYRQEKARSQELALLISDTLVLLEKFCLFMPQSWMVGGSPDFVVPMLHLLREPAADIQIKAAICLEQLILRGKLDKDQWFDLLVKIPLAVQESQQRLQAVQEHQTMEQSANGDTGQAQDQLSSQLGFHRALSRLLCNTLSSYLAHISSSKSILAMKGGDYEKFNTFTRLTVEFLQHPSGRVTFEQLSSWTALFRDPQLSQSGILAPYMADIVSCFTNHLVKIRWEDVVDETHPHAELLEASFEDKDSYEIWMADVRSKSSMLFKHAGHTEPCITAQTLTSKMRSLLTDYGNGQPHNFLNPSNGQLTVKNDAVIHFEAMALPLENALSGLPGWSMGERSDREDSLRLEKRNGTRAALSELAHALVAWQPTYLYLRFRRTNLLEALRFVWKYQPSTLLRGVESLIGYLGLQDEWGLESDAVAGHRLSTEIVGLKKRSGVALVAIARVVPHHLVPWLNQLSDATRSLLATDGLIPLNQTHLFEFLSCVATAVEDSQVRSNFIGGVLSSAVESIESPDVQTSIADVGSFLAFLGVAEVASNPAAATNPDYVGSITSNYYKLFTPLNQLLSVGRRCQEARKKGENRSRVERVLASDGFNNVSLPDEGPVSMNDLALDDPFIPLWPRLLPTLLQTYEVTLALWRPEHQAVGLAHPYQRYLYAISEDEAFISKNHDVKSGGVFGEGGTAGTVISGASRRDVNLVPKWSGWLNELRNTAFQLLCLLCTQRVLFSPELSSMYPRIVAVLTEASSLRSMEHRHFNQFMKHVVNFLLTSCPSSLYQTHLEPIAGPIFEHLRFRLEKTWLPVVQNSRDGSEGDILTTSRKALSTPQCAQAAALASQGGEAWFTWYYGHAGLYVGELDAITAEAAVEKNRVDLSRSFTDVLQVALALKGDWAQVLANFAKAEQLLKKPETAKAGASGHPNRLYEEGVEINADGSPKTPNQVYEDTRKLRRINGLCHFMFLESESIAGNLTLSVVQCLGYPDAYTCRRSTKLCHRILEVVAWTPHYAQLLGQQMFSQAVKNVATEPKWMVGIEWDMINVIRDIYCRLVLGQTLQFGGQGAGMQQPKRGSSFEQSKSVNEPLQGGGLLESPSLYPRQLLLSLPGVSESTVMTFEQRMSQKCSAKDQKETIRELLRTVADLISDDPQSLGAEAGLFDRAGKEESLLHANTRTSVVPSLPEKLVTYSATRRSTASEPQPEGLNALF